MICVFIYFMLEQVLSQFRGIKMTPHVLLPDFSFDECLYVTNARDSSCSEMAGYKIWSRELFQNNNWKHSRNNRSCGPRNLKFVVAEDGYLEDILRRVGSPDLIWLCWYKCPYSYLPSCVSRHAEIHVLVDMTNYR
jgi:hypothetical protein